MNTEFALNNVNTMLQANLESVLTDLETEVGTSTVTPTPGEYKIGVYEDPNLITMFPCVTIHSPFTRKAVDEAGFQIRRVSLRVLVWVAENDVSNLHRFVARYGDAVSRILRIKTNWSAGLHNSVIEDVNNTELYKTNVAYSQGVLIESTIDYLLGEN